MLIPLTGDINKKVVDVDAILEGMETSRTLLQGKMGAQLVTAQAVTAAKPTVKPEPSNQFVIIGAAVGGTVVVLVVLIVTLGYCYVRR